MIGLPYRKIDRRAVLKGALALSGGLAASGMAGCTAQGGASSTQSSGGPRRGGQLRLVAAGHATAGLNPLTSADVGSFIALFQIFDQLVRQEGGTIVNSLAETVEPNADATVWTIQVRRGATFHSGRPVTAADVAYSIRSLGDPRKSPNYSALYGDVDLVNLKVRDARTLEVPLHRARGDFRESTLSQMSLVYPDGTTDADWNKDIGSGPFKLVSTGSGGTVLAAYPDHWGGAPLLDGAQLTVVSDATARLNAVRSGQADYAVDVSPAGARSVARSSAVEIRKGGPSNSIARTFEMNITKDPFTDATVREALKLLVDRQQLVDNVLLGQGEVGNDVYGRGLPGYSTSLPQRQRDVDKARSLLAAAGVSTLTIKAADLVTGTVDAANLFAEQARDAGLQITVQRVASDTYFNDYAGVLATPLQAFYFINRPAANMIATYASSRSAFNVTGMGGGAFDAMLAAAQATVDDRARQARFDELQRYLWDNGGDVVWGFAEQLDAVTPGLGGVTLCQSVPTLATAYLPR